jgi:SAM-dependent methyltransferase
MPSRLRTAVRQKIEYLKAAYIDLRLFATGKSDPELPPLRLPFVGIGDFRSVGESLVKLLVEVGGLRASDRVLDIGCGIGRVAIPLTKFLESTYDGFDVVNCNSVVPAPHQLGESELPVSVRQSVQLVLQPPWRSGVEVSVSVR